MPTVVFFPSGRRHPQRCRFFLRSPDDIDGEDGSWRSPWSRNFKHAPVSSRAPSSLWLRLRGNGSNVSSCVTGLAAVALRDPERFQVGSSRWRPMSAPGVYVGSGRCDEEFCEG
ncbi:hypothetical protein MTO96_022018 [Rhipicephalus appendiculatus]